MSEEVFDLLIQGREGVIFDGKVQSLTSFNEEGEFDILPEHANFISLIKDIIKFEETNGEKKELDIGNALLRTKKNKVEIYLGIESFATDNMPTPKDTRPKTQSGEKV